MVAVFPLPSPDPPPFLPLTPSLPPQGSETCLAIFLPALVMGNFMVLNLFLALLLNSFNSDELKSRQDDMEEESKVVELLTKMLVSYTRDTRHGVV